LAVKTKPLKLTRHSLADSKRTNIECGINGVYHHVSQKHLKRYKGEFDFQYNKRSASLELPMRFVQIVSCVVSSESV
jgi:hypothetical protein